MAQLSEDRSEPLRYGWGILCPVLYNTHVHALPLALAGEVLRLLSP